MSIPRPQRAKHPPYVYVLLDKTRKVVHFSWYYFGHHPEDVVHAAIRRAIRRFEWKLKRPRGSIICIYLAREELLPGHRRQSYTEVFTRKTELHRWRHLRASARVAWQSHSGWYRATRTVLAYYKGRALGGRGIWQPNIARIKRPTDFHQVRKEA